MSSTNHRPIPELTQRDIDRFWKYVEKTDDCWIWIGVRNKLGYGRFGIRGHAFQATRVAYKIQSGSDPGEMSVCHHCDNPPCVRHHDKHLFLGTHAENMQDSINKGRFVYPINGIINRQKTHCDNGHEFSSKNTWTSKRNERHCKTCCRDRMRIKDGFGLRPTSQEINLAKTHCAKGHEFTPDNTYRRKNGWRACRECHLERMRKRSQLRL